MKIKSILIIVGILVFILWKVFYHPVFSPLDNELVTRYIPANSSDPAVYADPCNQRSHCVYIYLAPWCPHCRDFVPQIPTFRDDWKTMDRPGVRIVVGDDTKEAINAMAAGIKPPVFLDYNNQFLRAVHVRSFPYMFIVGTDGRIIASGTNDSIDWINKEINAHHS